MVPGETSGIIESFTGERADVLGLRSIFYRSLSYLALRGWAWLATGLRTWGRARWETARWKCDSGGEQRRFPVEREGG